MRQRLAIDLALCGLSCATAAFAQPQQIIQTWVASGGNDLNPCTRSAPCATFNGAIQKTQAGGEIDAADAGSYGAANITKAITIDGGGLATIIVQSVGTGVFVSTGASDLVVLRNITINGNGVGWKGVEFRSGNQLVLDNVRIVGFVVDGVIMGNQSAGDGSPRTMIITNSVIANSDLQFSDGVLVNEGVLTITHSVISGNGDFGLVTTNSAVINADDNVLTDNAIAVQSGRVGGDPAATIRLSNNDIYNNRTGFGCGGGVLASAGNNRKGGNTGGTAPTCSPTAVITQQ
jgi:hypothetical protein